MHSHLDPEAHADVWCHRCGEKVLRSRGNGLLAPCPNCSSTDVHVFAPPVVVPFRRRRAAMVMI